MSCPVCNSDQSQILGKKSNVTYVQCSNCSLVYADPIPELESLSKIYVYKAYDKPKLRLNLRALRLTLRIAPLMFLNNGRNFLDIGCNRGIAVEAARWLGFRSIGLDLNSNAIEQAKKDFPRSNYYNETLQAFSKRGLKFDIVYCTEVIEHIPDIHSFMSALVSLLKPGAILFFTTPDAGHFRVDKADMLKWREVRPKHISLYNKKSISFLFAMHGISIRFFYPMHRANMRFYARFNNKPS
jgi:2-polyprenyl-3-methyl-5-hydroxy-6-metoxy-1,4-benzoquinol methylase